MSRDEGVCRPFIHFLLHKRKGKRDVIPAQPPYKTLSRNASLSQKTQKCNTEYSTLIDVP